MTSAFLLTGNAAHENQQLVSAPIAAVDIPSFIEAKSPVSFQVVSEFPNNCFALGPTSYRLDQDRKVILFHVSAYENKAHCDETKTALSRVITVGQLSEGTYEVRELKSLKKWGSIQVQHFEVSADSVYPEPKTLTR